ncbi:MAG: YqaE/Pmp3 family membrane protein [Vicingaceae bacterium]|nr:YqaE/Pmp3 family membrane protein [Vicingaceae bacterium]
MKSKSDYNWNSYNRSIDFSKMNDANKVFKGESFAQHNFSAQQVDEVVLIILGIILPPLAVYLYEGAITNNFWLDLILLIITIWIGGIIYAFLVMYGGVSIN